MPSSTMTFDQWQAKFRVSDRIPFLHDPAVRKADPLTVWTEVETDGKRTIINGKHFVNREAHYLSQIPFVEGDFIEVSLDDDEEDLEQQALG